MQQIGNSVGEAIRLSMQNPTKEIGVPVLTSSSMMSEYDWVKYEPYRDTYKGKKFQGTARQNFGSLEEVDFTYEQRGIQRVKFKSGGSIETAHIGRFYKEISPITDDGRIPQVELGALAAAGDPLVLKDVVAQKQKALQITNSNPIQEQSVVQEQPIQQVQQPVVEQKVSPQKTQEQYIVKEEKQSPIYDALRKRKKPVKTNLELELTIPPNVDLYHLLDDTYDNALDEIISFLFLKENEELLRESFKNSLKKLYEIEEDNGEDSI